MPALLISREIALMARNARGTATAISIGAIVAFVLVPLAFVVMAASVILVVIRHRRQRKARLLAQAEGSNVHLYSNGYQNTGSCAAGNGNYNNGGGWVVNNTGPAPSTYRAMPAEHATNTTSSSIPQADGVAPVDAPSLRTSPGAEYNSLAAPGAVYGRDSSSATHSMVDLTANAQPPAGR